MWEPGCWNKTTYWDRERDGAEFAGHSQKQRGPAGRAEAASLRVEGRVCRRPALLTSPRSSLWHCHPRGPAGPFPSHRPGGQRKALSPLAGYAVKEVAEAVPVAGSGPRAPRCSRGLAQGVFPVGCCPCSRACHFSPVSASAAGPLPRVAGSPSPPASASRPAAPTCAAPRPRPRRVPGAARLSGQRGWPGLTLPTGNQRSAFKPAPERESCYWGFFAGTGLFR